MKKILMSLLIITLITSCSTPNQRAEIVEEFGEIIWRQSPTSHDVFETFLCKDENNHLSIIRVQDDASISSINKISGYKVIPICD